MLLSNISSSLCDFKSLQKILIRLFTKRRNPSFKYAICGVRKWNRLIYEVKYICYYTMSILRNIHIIGTVFTFG